MMSSTEAAEKKIKKLGRKPERKEPEKSKDEKMSRGAWPVVSPAAGSSNKIRTERYVSYWRVPSGWVM